MIFWIILTAIGFCLYLCALYNAWTRQDRRQAELLDMLSDIRRELMSLNADAAERRRIQ